MNFIMQYADRIELATLDFDDEETVLEIGEGFYIESTTLIAPNTCLVRVCAELTHRGWP